MPYHRIVGKLNTAGAGLFALRRFDLSVCRMTFLGRRIFALFVLGRLRLFPSALDCRLAPSPRGFGLFFHLLGISLEPLGLLLHVQGNQSCQGLDRQLSGVVGSRTLTVEVTLVEQLPFAAEKLPRNFPVGLLVKCENRLRVG